MNILDENISRAQAALLESWRFHFRQVSVSIGRRGMRDEDVIPMLLKQHLPTFFTRDSGFYNPLLCHSRYCLVVLDVRKDEAASFIQRFLRHSAFSTRAKRMGKVIRASRAKMSVRSVAEPSREIKLGWFSMA